MINSVLPVCLISCLLSFISANLTAQLSDNAQISLLTCGPGEELYSVFGHSAIRVYDPEIGLDEVYNYGVFDYTDPKFLPKFLKGKLIYWVGKESTEHFLNLYGYLNRFVKEEVIHLDSLQMNSVYLALKENHKIENRYYLYDFLFDNCSTRIGDILEKGIWPFQFSDTEKFSFRDLIHQYLGGRDWTHLGIDLILGSKTDRIATAREQMFLPDYLSDNLANAKKENNKNVLLAPQMLLDIPTIRAKSFFLLSPVLAFTILLILELIFLKYGEEKWLKTYDIIWMIGMTLSSIVLMFMWFGTDHQACSNNYNLLIFSPLLIIWWLAYAFRNGKKALTIIDLLIVIPYISLPFVKMTAQDIHPVVLLIALITIFKLVRIGGLNAFRNFF